MVPAGKTSFIAGKIYYRATIYENGKPIANLKGKYNSREDLQKFLRNYWPGDMKSKPIKQYEVELQLKVWQYFGAILDKVVNDVTIPRPFFVNFV